MQTIWLARHANRQDFADPDWAATADRPYDPGLSPDGIEQAEQLGRRVDRLGVDRIVSSPYLRTVQTAHHVATTTGHRVVLEPGLGEWLNDDWFDGLPNTHTPTALADRFSSVRPSSESPCRQPTYPESRHEALGRLGATGTCLAKQYADDATLLLVGHGITVQGVLHGLVGAGVPDAGCPLASLTKVERRDGGWSIFLRNDTTHLENGSRASDRLA